MPNAHGADVNPLAQLVRESDAEFEKGQDRHVRSATLRTTVRFPPFSQANSPEGERTIRLAVGNLEPTSAWSNRLSHPKTS
jgi:hypothetical protein